MKILIMGLPGSGKTTLASKLVPLIKAKWLNNDEVRKAANDWDFSEEARKRQAKRMADLAEKYSKDQLEYASKDVLYLHQLKLKLEKLLKRENKVDLACQCFAFLKTRSALDLEGFEDLDIFAH